MATDFWANLVDGAVSAGTFISLISNGVIAMWSPVIMVSPADATRLPRVTTTTVSNDPLVLGVAVGGSGKIENGQASTVAGDIVQVQIYGVTKLTVDGNVANIAIGDYLITHSTAGQARKVTAYPTTYAAGSIARYVFAKAMFASTVAGDTIVAFLTGGSQ